MFFSVLYLFGYQQRSSLASDRREESTDLQISSKETEREGRPSFFIVDVVIVYCFFCICYKQRFSIHLYLLIKSDELYRCIRTDEVFPDE